MKSSLLTGIALLASVCTVFARDINTVNGQTYRDVTVTRVEKTGIAITHRDGVGFLKFSDLPADALLDFTRPEADPDSVQPSPELEHTPEITTLDGNVYRDVTIARIERTGIRVSHRNGIAFIDYITLPVALRRRYGYTEASYAAGRAVRQQRDQIAAETQRRIAVENAAREAEAQWRRAEAQAALAQQQSSIATRDYNAGSYATRDYGTDRYSADRYTGGTVQVSGYYRKDGTYVRPYARRK